MKEYLIFSERMKEAMKKNNRMTQMELSKITGITNVSISRYINGQRVPKITEIIKIANALDVSCDFLLGIDDDFNGKESDTIYVKRALEYCEKAADGWSDFGKRALENIGHGDSYKSSFGAVAYAAQQEDIYRYTVPSIIRNLSKISQELVKD